MAEVPSFVGSDNPFTHSQQRDTEALWTYKAILKREVLVQMFRELTQGTLHRLCCILKRCWIMRRRITHVILLATHLSRIASISYLLFLHSKFLDDRNTMSWVMPSWHILITKRPSNNCKGFEERCTKTSSERFQVATTSVREYKWADILMLELRSISFFTLAVTKPQSGLFSLCGFVTAFTWHMYHSILISR